jgi:uncharacterized membrane protein
MNKNTSKKTDLKEFSVWIFSIFCILLLLIFSITEYLRGALNEWLFENSRLFLVLLTAGVVIISFTNSLKLLRRKDAAKNAKWIILSSLPFILFMVAFLLAFNWKNIIESYFN